MRTSRRSTVAWSLFLLCLVGGCAAFFYFIALPVYKQPDARLWATWVGYPTVLRRLGRPIPVSVATAERHHMTDVISAVGTVQYLDSVPIDTEAVGVVVSVQVQPGDHVEPGETLMTVSTGGQEARQAQYDLDVKTHAYNKAKADYERDLQALKKGLISQANFDATEAAYLESQDNMKKSKDSLEATLLTRSMKVAAAAAIDPPETSGSQTAAGAPVPAKVSLRPTAQPNLATDLNGFGERLPIIALTPGTVQQVNAYVGQNLTQPTNKLIMIGDRLVFAASVDQRYFGRIRIGDKASIFLRALDGGTLHGQVVRVDPTIAGQQAGASNGAPVMPFTFSVWLDIDSSGRALAAGMNGYCAFSRNIDPLAIPDAALMRYSGGQGVVGVVDQTDHVRFVAVTYSINSEGWVAIESGLKPGDRVVLAGQTGLRDGDEVVIH